MTAWIVPCNINKYDVIGAFRHLPAVDWKQSFHAEVGDIVFIYVSKPIGALTYKTRVNKVDLSEIEIDDSKYVIDGKGYVTSPNHMELELIDSIGLNRYYLEKLREYGVKGNIQGPMRVPEALAKLMGEQGDL